MLGAIATTVRILLLVGGEAKNLVLQAQCRIVLTPETPKLSAEAVRELYHNDSSRTCFGINGRQYAREHYNRECTNLKSYLLKSARASVSASQKPACLHDGVYLYEY
jgi:hypothetical protein